MMACMLCRCKLQGRKAEEEKESVEISSFVTLDHTTPYFYPLTSKRRVGSSIGSTVIGIIGIY